MKRNNRVLATAACLLLAAATASAQTWSDRFVWVFGWSLSKDSDVAEITKLLETSAKSGLNGAVFSLGFDSLCKHDDAYFRRLERNRRRLQTAQHRADPRVSSASATAAASSATTAIWPRDSRRRCPVRRR